MLTMLERRFDKTSSEPVPQADAAPQLGGGVLFRPVIETCTQLFPVVGSGKTDVIEFGSAKEQLQSVKNEEVNPEARTP